MKKIAILLGVALVAFSSCRKDLKKADPIANKYQVEANQEVLEERFIETVEDIQLNDASTSLDAMRWMHVANLDAPLVGGKELAIADMHVNGNLGVIAYYTEGLELGGAIDVLDLTDPDIPMVTSTLSIKSTDLSQVAIDGDAVYAIGYNDLGQQVLHRVQLEGALLTSKVIEQVLDATIITDLSISDNAVVAQLGDKTASFAKNTLEVNESALKTAASSILSPLSISGNEVKFFNAKNGEVKATYTATSNVLGATEYKNVAVVSNAGKGMVVLQAYKSSFKEVGYYAVESNKVAAHSEYLLVAENGGLSIVQGIDAGDYEKCRRNKKSKKKNKKSSCKNKRKCGKKCYGKCKKDRDNDNNDDSNDNTTADCNCEDGIKSLTFTYTGETGRTFYVKNYRDHRVIQKISNAVNGESYTVEGLDCYRGKFGSKTKIWFNYREYYIFNSTCSSDLVGEEFGPVSITGLVDGQGTECTVTPPAPEENEGEGEGEDCQCEGKMKDFTILYTGESGRTLYATSHKSSTPFAKIRDLVQGETYTISGFDHKGRLDAKTYICLDNAPRYEVHTSCSIDILGQESGPFQVVAYTDGEGSSCSIDIPDPEPVETFMECTVVGADPGYAFFQAVWLDDFSLLDGVLFDRGFRFEGGHGVFKELPDGKAILTGEIYSPNYPNNRWDMTVYFTQKSTWEEWSALGKTYKYGNGYVDGAHESWIYYMMDETKNNVMVGLGDNAGFTSNLTQRPANGMMGFQIGEGGANDKNSAYGMAGWFFYEHPDGSIKHADWNLDVLNCVEK